MSKFVVISMPNCVWCQRAIKLLEENGLAYEKYDIKENNVMGEFIKSAGFTTVPQIFTDGKLIGGHDSLVAYLNENKTITV